MENAKPFSNGQSTPVSFGIRRAFTLIELLFIIAIIALLPSILFPVFGRARESARRSACLSNLKQIGVAQMQYTADYDDTYPPYSGEAALDYTIAANGDTITNTGWCFLLQPYMKNTQIFKCPSTKLGQIPGVTNCRYTDYIYNSLIGVGTKVPPVLPGKFTRMSEMTFPSCTLPSSTASTTMEPLMAAPIFI